MAYNLEWSLWDIFFLGGGCGVANEFSLKERKHSCPSLQNLLPSCDIVLPFFFFFVLHYYTFSKWTLWATRRYTMAKIHMRGWNLGLGASDPTFLRLLTRKGHLQGERTKWVVKYQLWINVRQAPEDVSISWLRASGAQAGWRVWLRMVGLHKVSWFLLPWVSITWGLWHRL